VPYFLHCIVVHSGEAESGHYFSYIFDRQRQKWFKFDDYKVSEESEQAVFEVSRGGKDKSACCCLIYLSQDQISKMALDLENYAKAFSERLPAWVVNKVITQNKFFEMKL